MQDDGKLNILGNQDDQFKNPINEMNEQIVKHREAHKLILDKYIEHEKLVDSVTSNWESTVKDRITQAYRNDLDLFGLQNRAKEMIESLNVEIRAIEDKTDMMESKADKLFECGLKTNILNLHLPQNEEYLEDMNDVLSQVTKLEKRLRKVLLEFNNTVPKIFEDLKIERRQQAADGQDGKLQLSALATATESDL